MAQTSTLIGVEIWHQNLAAVHSLCPLWVMRGHFAMRKRCSLDHLVSAGKYCRRDCEAQCLRSSKIDNQLILGWSLHRQIGGLLALEDAVDISCPAPHLVNKIGSIGD
jgi:hypothetical protein